MFFIGFHDDKSDYHTEMNTKLVMSKFDYLVRTLDQPSVIVIDNALYHNALTEDTKAPNTSAKKSVLQDWLCKHKITFPPVQTKAELYELVKKHKHPNVYENDVRAGEAGHIVL